MARPSSSRPRPNSNSVVSVSSRVRSSLTAVGDEHTIDLTLSTLFEFGLRRLLDGFATWLAGRG